MAIDRSFFRHEYARIVAALVRRYGYHAIEEAEDATGDALMRATELWEERGVPDNPGAWLMRVAQRRLVDALRRRATYRDRVEPRLSRDLVTAPVVPEPASTSAGAAPAREGDGAPDDEERLLFACAHPSVPIAARVALSLRALFGLSVGEIADLACASYETTQKRLYRAREHFRRNPADVTPVSSTERAGRIESVLLVLYLVFTAAQRRVSEAGVPRMIEGIDLAADVLSRLDHMVAPGYPLDDDGRGAAHALAAMVSMHVARHAARGAGLLVPLVAVDRSQWNDALLHHAARHLESARCSRRASRYHLEAAIAAEYTFAPGWSAIDWNAICGHYEALRRFGLTRRARMGHAIARSYATEEASERAAAVAALRHVAGTPAADRDPEIWAAVGVLCRRAGQLEEAEAAFDAAIAASSSDAEREWIRLASTRDA